MFKADSLLFNLITTMRFYSQNNMMKPKQGRSKSQKQQQLFYSIRMTSGDKQIEPNMLSLNTAGLILPGGILQNRNLLTIKQHHSTVNKNKTSKAAQTHDKAKTNVSHCQRRNS